MKNLVLSALAAGSVVAAAPASAQVISTSDIHLMVMGDDSHDGETYTVAKDAPVLVTKAYAPRAVRLNESIKVGGIGNEIEFPAGAVLFGRFDRTVWTYCGAGQLNAESRITAGAAAALLTAGFSLLLEPFMENARVNCLLDGDKDGVFESAWGGDVPVGESALAVYDVGQQNMSAPAPYERIDPKQGPVSPIEITWRKGNGATVVFTEVLGGLVSETVSAAIPAPGSAPASVDISGVKLKLKSYNASTETITVEIEEGYRDHYSRVAGRRIITTTYYYY